MTDEELITMVRDQRSNVPMTTPVEQIISRGRAVRTRRRIPGIAGAVAGAAAVALAVAALLPAGHQANRQPPMQLAAWTVVKHADGTVVVTVRQLRDPAGLQRKLRADGVPATVTFSSQEPRACHNYPLGPALLHRIFSFNQPPLVIHPSALPDGTGIRLSPVHHPPGAPIALAAGLVHTSPQCTGSSAGQSS
jgi:hypothetical protein